MKTVFPTRAQSLQSRRWLVVDAKGIPLGRVASKVAALLRGKNKTDFVPHTDCGEFVIVINAKEVKLTGKKLSQKVYRDYSGYVGGLREKPVSALLGSGEAVRRAVQGMLPRGPLGYALLRKLKVYPGPVHPHTAQMPQPIELYGKKISGDIE